MQRLLTTSFALAVAAILSIAGSAVAQQRPAAQAPAPAPAPATTPAAQPQLARTEIVNHDNWQVTCREFVNPASRNCAAVLQLIQVNQQTNQQTMLMSWIVGVENNTLTSVIQTPTGVAIAPGVEVKIGRQTRKLTFARCEAQRCEAVMPIDDALTREAAGQEKAEIVLTSTTGGTVTFNLPLKGIDKALPLLRR
jgi:invasion protein IalB